MWSMGCGLPRARTARTLRHTQGKVASTTTTTSQEAGEVPPCRTRSWDLGGARRPPASPRACRSRPRLFPVPHRHGTRLWRGAQPPPRARQAVVETVARRTQRDHFGIMTNIASGRRAGGRRAQEVKRECVQAVRRVRTIG